MATRFNVIDFHNHHTPKRLEQSVVQASPAGQRARWDLLGAGNVIAGSDWPINAWPVRAMLGDASRQARLSDDERNAIAAGNCLRLLGIG